MSGCAHGAAHAAHPAVLPRADREAERRSRESSHAAAAAPFAIEPVDQTARRTRIERLKGLLAERIVILDGAMGTMIQLAKLDEAGYRRAAARSRP